MRCTRIFIKFVFQDKKLQGLQYWNFHQYQHILAVAGWNHPYIWFLICPNIENVFTDWLIIISSPRRVLTKCFEVPIAPPPFFFTQNFLDPRSFWTNNNFGPFFWTQNVWKQNFFGSQFIFHPPNILDSRFLDPKFVWPKFSWSRIFSFILYVHIQFNHPSLNISHNFRWSAPPRISYSLCVQFSSIFC